MQERAPRFDPRLVDGAVVVAVAVPALLGLVAYVVAAGLVAPPMALPAVALALFQAGVLWWRRRQPLKVLVATLAALLIAQALGDVNAASYVGPHAAAYAVAVYGNRRATVIGAGCLGLAVALNYAVAQLVPAALPYGAVLLSPTGALVVIAWGVGRYVRVRRGYLETLVAYAYQLEVERDEKARRAVADERRRIARELHDQVAHHLGVAALQTGAARAWIDRDPGRAADAMASVEEAVRAALTTMPVILEALRTDDAGGDRSPQPTLRELENLVEKVSATGLAVDLRVDGERAPLPPAVEHAAYRIVQEALTNTMKHAAATRSEVRLRFAPASLDVEVSDDGTGEGPGGGAGLGLVGMRERAELLGGSLEAGARGGGGFVVRARLPVGTPQVAR